MAEGHIRVIIPTNKHYRGRLSPEAYARVGNLVRHRLRDHGQFKDIGLQVKILDIKDGEFIRAWLLLTPRAVPWLFEIVEILDADPNIQAEATTEGVEHAVNPASLERLAAHRQHINTEEQHSEAPAQWEKLREKFKNDPNR